MDSALRLFPRPTTDVPNYLDESTEPRVVAVDWKGSTIISTYLRHGVWYSIPSSSLVCAAATY